MVSWVWAYIYTYVHTPSSSLIKSESVITRRQATALEEAKAAVIKYSALSHQSEAELLVVKRELQETKHQTEERVLIVEKRCCRWEEAYEDLTIQQTELARNLASENIRHKEMGEKMETECARANDLTKGKHDVEAEMQSVMEQLQRLQDEKDEQQHKNVECQHAMKGMQHRMIEAEKACDDRSEIAVELRQEIEQLRLSFTAFSAAFLSERQDEAEQAKIFWACLCACMCVFVYVCVCVCMYVCVCVCVRLRVCGRAWACVGVRVFLSMYACCYTSICENTIFAVHILMHINDLAGQYAVTKRGERAVCIDRVA